MPKAINWAFYPHILDCVLEFASAESVDALCLLDLSICDHVDRIAKHVVCIDQGDPLYTRAGRRVRLPICGQPLARRVRTLDIYPKTIRRSLEPEPHLPFPDLDYIRLLGNDDGTYMPHICDTTGTIIQLVLPRVPAERFKIGGRVDLRTERRIAVFPSDLSKVRARSVTWNSPGGSMFMERTIVFLPELNNALDNVPEARASSVRDASLKLRNITGGPDAVRSVIVVGLEHCVAHTSNDALRYLGDAGQTKFESSRTYLADLCFPGIPEDERDIRFLSIEEWRTETTETEWSLVASLPDACKAEWAYRTPKLTLPDIPSRVFGHGPHPWI